VLERAFLATYGLEMPDLFMSEDLAIGSYRQRRQPDDSRDYRDRLARQARGDSKTQSRRAEEKFIFNLSPQEYDQAYGTDYRKPGLLGAVSRVLYKLLPKIGPLRPLAFKAPTKEAEALFLESFKDTRERYRVALVALAAGHLELPNTNFDTGKLSARAITSWRIRRTRSWSNGCRGAAARCRRRFASHRRVLRRRSNDHAVAQRTMRVAPVARESSSCVETISALPGEADP